MRLRSLFVLGFVSFLAQPTLAQQNLTVPRVSPHASVSQTIGLTDVTIDYHRPAINGRAIYGGLVPYDQVWRAGANDNTTISFSSPVTVAGAALDAGTYGLHMIPRQSGTWTVIFSTMADAWGSFSYDEAEDAARIEATPRSAPVEEQLSYRFDAPTNTSAVVVMRWADREVPFTITANTPAVVLASMEREMRNLPRFGWQGWNQIAGYALQTGQRPEEALAWADQSISMNRNFTNLMTRAGLLGALGNGGEADRTRAEALTLATENEVNAYGYQLLGAGDTAGALAIFRQNVEDHPDSWNVHDSLAEALAAQGQTAEAITLYEKARSMAPQPQHARIDGVLTQLRAQN